MTQATDDYCWCLACDPKSGEIGLVCRKGMGKPTDDVVANRAPIKLWLWKNGDHYLAFDNEYPCQPCGDPMVLGEPSATAIFEASTPREATASRLAAVTAERDRLREALQPFADAVYNDNDQMTYNHGQITSENLYRAYWAMREPVTPKEPAT